MGEFERLEETRQGRARGLVSSRQSGSRVEARMFRAPPDLEDVVDRFWVGRWDLTNQEPHTTELIGDPAVNLVCEESALRVVGVWTDLWVRKLEGVGLVRAAKLHPGAGAAFLDGEINSFSNRHTVLDGPGREVLEGTDEEGLQVLADWMRGRRRNDPKIAIAVHAMRTVRTEPVNRVDELARREGLSVRALQRLFRTHVGASPKWAIRWTRLQEVAVRVDAGEAPDLADLAYRLGYADQAHLARDFRQATGRTLRGFEKQR